MRGQVILLTAVLIAVAITAVLVLQMVSTSSPGFAGVRAAYGVFSRDVSKAVDAIASYMDYVGLVTLLNFTENMARYGLLGSAYLDYSNWLSIRKTAQMACASMEFFILNRAPLGLAADLPAYCLQYSVPISPDGKKVILSGLKGYTTLNVTLSKPPNGAYIQMPQPYIKVLYKNTAGSSLEPVSLFEVVLPNKTYTSSYRISMLLNVSLLALARLNITKSFSISVRVLDVDAVCTTDMICVNITVSKPYSWTTFFEVLNRSIIKDGGAWKINYTQQLAQFDLVNYTEYSAVYKISVSGLKEYLVKAYVGNIPLYIPPRDIGVNCRCGSSWCSVINSGNTPIVLYSNTQPTVVNLGPSANITLIQLSSATYWIIHRNGWLNFTNINPSNFCGKYRNILAIYSIYWFYP